MGRSAALALFALAAAPAAAQFRPAPMVVPSALDADVLPGRYTSAATPGELVTVDRATGTGELRPYRALLSPAAYPGILPGGTTYRAGRTRASAADAITEVVYPIPAALWTGSQSWVGVQFVTPLQAITLPVIPTTPRPGVASFAHLLAHDGDAIVFADAGIGSGAGFLYAIDLGTSSLGGTADSDLWWANGLGPLEATEHELLPLRISAAARALAIDDLALPTRGGVLVAAHVPASQPGLLYATPPTSLPAISLADVRVGGDSALERPPWLPPSIARKGDALGAAAFDLDGDGLPDLLFSYGSALEVPDGVGGLLQNHLVAVAGTADARELASGAWRDATADLGLRDPVTVRPVEIAGFAGAAIWDRTLDEVVVAWRDPSGLRIWRGAAAGRRVRDLRVADVVGSASPDLVVAAEDVLVYPDATNASPALTWAAGSGGPAIRGADLPLSVEAGDADGGIAVAWLVGDPYGAPVATATVPAGPAQVVPYTWPGALLCGAAPQTLQVTVRATDDLGVYAELSAVLDVVYPAPVLTLASGVAGDRLVLPPGGTTAVLAGASEAGCATQTFTWGGTLFGAAPWVEEGTATTTRRTADLAEATYPALLAGGDPTATLVASDGGATSAPAALTLDLDASGLVEVVHAADVSALAPGEVALLRTTLRSRLGVALPGVHVIDALDGLVPAGSPSVTGAAATGALRDGAELVLDVLPAGAEVVIELPVRAGTRRGASAVEVRSSGGHLLTPAAGARGEDTALPGCGCGGGAGAEALLALAAALLLRRRRAT